MINYKDDPEYQRANRRVQWLIVEAAKITRELNQAEVDFLRDGTPTSRIYRAELVEQRSAYQLEIKELEIKLYDLKEAGRLSQRQDKYDTLVTLLNDGGLGHWVKRASDIRNANHFSRTSS